MPSILPINLDDLLTFAVVESPRVELKATWDPVVTLDQVLRTICAFANDLQNLNGGYVVIGVAEDQGVAVLPPSGIAPQMIDTAMRAIRDNCRRLDPEYQPVLSPEVHQGRHLLVVWAPASDTRPHQAPESTRRGANRHFYVRQGSQTVVAQGAILQTLLQQTARVPFDARRTISASIERMSETRVRAFLADIRSALIDERSAREIYRRMRIAVPVNGHEVPLNVGLMFFADDPEEWFPGARIEVVQFAGGAPGDVLEERIFRGPVHQQLRDAIAYLRNLSTRHLEKLRDRPEAKGWVSYPLPALEEALVNAVYHRSYEGVEEPTKVYLYPDRLEVISYPGPLPGIESHHLQAGGQVPLVPARNRRIGELLKELRLAEQRGTGVPKVYRAMRENGSPDPRFDFDEGRTYFRVTLPAHPDYVAVSALRDSAHLKAIGDRTGARDRLVHAYVEQPDSGVLAAALIEDHARNGDLAAARAIYDQFSRRADRHGGTRAWLAMAEAYLDAKRGDDARALLDHPHQPLSTQEIIDAAIVEKRADRFREAHQYFLEVGDAVLHDVRALHEFAQTKMRLAGDAVGARERSPFADDARTRLLNEAREMLRRVLQMDAPPTRRAWAWFDLARVLRWLHAPESEVRHALDQAIRLLPTEARFKQELERLGPASR